MAGSALPRDTSSLDGVRVLLVEDDFLILMDLEDMLSAAGAKVIAECRNVEDALEKVEDDELEVEVAVLDMRLGDESAAPVARRLAERGVPFVFYSGQIDGDPVFAEWPDHELVHKPARSEVIVRAVAAAARA